MYRRKLGDGRALTNVPSLTVSRDTTLGPAWDPKARCYRVLRQSMAQKACYVRAGCRRQCHQTLGALCLNAGADGR